MSTPTPVPTQPIRVTPKDTTLTATPHIVAVAVGAICGFLTTKIGLSPQYVALASIGLTAALTTGVHFIMAKLSE